MILSGSYLILLDPSGRYLPEDSRANSYVVPLDKMKGYVLLTVSKPCHILTFDLVSTPAT